MRIFEVGDKVKVVDASHEWGEVRKGDKGVVESINPDGTYEVMIDNFSKQVTWTGEWYCFKLCKKRIKNKDRIKTLEKEFNELKEIVNDLLKQKPSKDVRIDLMIEENSLNLDEEVVQGLIGGARGFLEFEGHKYQRVYREANPGDVIIVRHPARGTAVANLNIPHLVVQGKKGEPCINRREDALVYSKAFGRTEKTVEVYELVSETEKSKKNEKRTKIIQKAKDFIEECKDVSGGFTHTKCYKHNLDGYADAEFEVNSEKRMVSVFLLRQLCGSLLRQGIYQAPVGTVFNAHIGKAIALGRALGLDVSDFEAEIEPDEVVPGMVVMGFCSAEKTYEDFRVEKVVKEDGDIKIFGRPKKTFPEDLVEISRCKNIIDDTYAVY